MKINDGSTVHAIQRNSTNNRNSYVKKITKRHTARRSSLALKVEARNLARQKAKHTNALQKSFIFSNVNTESIAEITDQSNFPIMVGTHSGCSGTHDLYMGYSYYTITCYINDRIKNIVLSIYTG